MNTFSDFSSFGNLFLRLHLESLQGHPEESFTKIILKIPLQFFPNILPAIFQRVFRGIWTMKSFNTSTLLPPVICSGIWTYHICLKAIVGPRPNIFSLSFQLNSPVNNSRRYFKDSYTISRKKTEKVYFRFLKNFDQQVFQETLQEFLCHIIYNQLLH